MDSCTFLPQTPGSTIQYGNEEADTNEKERLLSFIFHHCSIQNHHPRHLTRQGHPFSKADVLNSLALKASIIIFSTPGILKLPSSCMMSCLWKLCCFCLSKADQETGAMGETSAGRRHLPRNPPPSRDTAFTPRASSELSAPKRSPSTKSSSSESNRAKPATKYLSSLLNDTTTPANLRVEFLKGFGIADHSGVGDELRDLSCATGAASHAVPSGLTSEDATRVRRIPATRR